MDNSRPSLSKHFPILLPIGIIISHPPSAVSPHLIPSHSSPNLPHNNDNDQTPTKI